MLTCAHYRLIGARLTMIDTKSKILPFKSVAIALLFSVFLGPVGLLYASLLGGIIMIVVGFVVISAKFMVPIAMTWVTSCIWAVASTNRYNQKLLKLMSESH
jgi:hypothetical protein